MGPRFDASRPAKWFRMYAEFATDPKVQMLTEVLQRRFVMLLCLRCSNGDETLQEQAIACYLRISNDEWESTKESLMQEGLVDEHGIPTSWDKRQFVSDVSTDRVRTYRDKKKRFGNVSNEKGNVNETSSETETETETEVKTHTARVSPLGSDEFKIFFADYPIQTGRNDALHVWVKRRLDFCALDVMAALEKWKECERWQNPQFIPYAAKWLSDQWRSEPVKGVSKNEQKRQGTKQAIERVRAGLVRETN